MGWKSNDNSNMNSIKNRINIYENFFGRGLKKWKLEKKI